MKPHLSPNQRKCHIDRAYFPITYSKDIPHNPIEAAIEVIDVIEVLRSVFEPTSADLRLGCARKEDLKWDIKVPPLEAGWHIRRANLPLKASVRREFASVDPNSSPNFEAPLLSKPILVDWVKKAFNQKCPEPEVYELAWFEFDFNTVRTKIFTEELLVGQSTMKAIYDSYRGYYELEYPLVRENGQLWVYSPISDLFLFPTFGISVNHDDWQEIMELKIKVNWSWWTQFGFKEQEILFNTIPQIEALGWDLELIDDLDDYQHPS